MFITKVYTVIGTELGWNCIVGVYYTKQSAYNNVFGEEEDWLEKPTEEQIDNKFKISEYILQEKIII